MTKVTAKSCMNDPRATLAWRQLTDRNTSRKVLWPSKVPRIGELRNKQPYLDSCYELLRMSRTIKNI